MWAWHYSKFKSVVHRVKKSGPRDSSGKYPPTLTKTPTHTYVPHPLTHPHYTYTFKKDYHLSWKSSALFFFESIRRVLSRRDIFLLFKSSTSLCWWFSSPKECGPNEDTMCWVLCMLNWPDWVELFQNRWDKLILTSLPFLNICGTWTIQ